MADMSTSQKTSMDIFRGIMDHGPLTLYLANSKTKMPIGTIHRHFKQLEKTGKIRVYESKKKGRKKIEYGPTIYGIISFYKQDKEFAKKIQNYFLIWIENKEFQNELEKEGFDVTIDNLKKSKQIFQKYMDYFSAVEEQIEMIKRGEDIVSRDTLIMISSGLLSTNPQYQKLWTELYSSLPGMRKSLDDYMENMIKSYKEFKKNLK
ncbi:MAG: ArsR family transcriptional regulator [Nitrosarchaeum sp.]|nr:MAG: ArsR family transcriptional regulator [Nitrosarchaeum sp.]